LDRRSAGRAAFDYRKKKLLYLERLAAIEKGISLDALVQREMESGRSLVVST
jgi:hypothetical protein